MGVSLPTTGRSNSWSIKIQEFDRPELFLFWVVPYLLLVDQTPGLSKSGSLIDQIYSYFGWFPTYYGRSNSWSIKIREFDRPELFLFWVVPYLLWSIKLLVYQTPGLSNSWSIKIREFDRPELFLFWVYPYLLLVDQTPGLSKSRSLIDQNYSYFGWFPTYYWSIKLLVYQNPGV